MAAPPDNGGGRDAPRRPGRNTQMTPRPSRTTGVAIITEGPVAEVVDLQAWRWRPWSGWWGTSHLATWNFAERSGRIA